MPGAVRRALDGQILSAQRNGETVEVKGGRLEARVAPGGGLKHTRHGLVVNKGEVGEKNHAPMARINQINTSSATAAIVGAALNELLDELKRTGRLR
jgi:hypothetical protein